MFIKINRVVLAVGSKNNGLNHLGALAQDMLGIPPDYSIALYCLLSLAPPSSENRGGRKGGMVKSGSDLQR